MTDFAECPACGDDGPHQVEVRDSSPDHLVCVNGCGSWPSPYTHEGNVW